jgi:CRISPR-associated protein Cas1
VVRAKLGHQAAVLEALGKPGAPLRALSKRVRSGDPDNLEAQGARRYWPLLFGEEFRRDREQQGINAMLNYGYTVLRAATARAVIAAGLHPTLGIHHQNEANSMRLVDDLMEPFRPYIDYTIWRLAQSTSDMELDRSAKTAIVRALFIELETDAGATPIQVCLQRLASSLAQVFTGEQAGLDLPKPSPSRLA